MEEVNIKLDGGGLNFSGKIPLFQAVQILGVITRPQATEPTANNDIEVLSPGVAASTPLIDTNAPKFESPREAIIKLYAKTNPQKVVALAFFAGATSTNGTL